jgi:hypothetical protein
LKRSDNRRVPDGQKSKDEHADTNLHQARLALCRGIETHFDQILLPSSADAFVSGVIPPSELKLLEEFVAGLETSVAGEAGPPTQAAPPESDPRGTLAGYASCAPACTPANPPETRAARPVNHSQNSCDLRLPLLL